MWAPITLDQLNDLIRASDERSSPEERTLWNLIRLPPRKWCLSPWGDEGGGFWVVGLIGSRVIWYNDIEDGFNHSRYDEYGTIAEYWCNQDEDLRPILLDLLRLLGISPSERDESP